MKNRTYSYLLAVFCCLNLYAQEISVGQRDKLHSEILQQDREFSVYFPPSYNSELNQKYPVLYILDGDYNFQYVAGLLELQGPISELIPEMILVAISGKGTNEYRKNCKPQVNGVADSGNAEEMASFIKKELIPYINIKYKASDYKILGGHSVGGIFVINTAINHPNLFNDYIAISPALYWGKNAMDEIMINTWGKSEGTTTSLYISLANEKGMDVDKFLKKVPKNIMEKNIHYKEFPDEIHNSVGLPTYRWALTEIFNTWRVQHGYFDSAEALKKHSSEVQKQYGSVFNIPLGVLGYTNYIVQKDDKEREKIQIALKEINPNAVVLFNNYLAGKLVEEKNYQKAHQLLKDALSINPNNFDSYNVISKMEYANGNKEEAKKNIDKAINLAIKQQVRQWQINELLETKEAQL